MMIKPHVTAALWDIIRLAPIHFQSRVVLIGFPGAGNVLAATICKKLLEQAGVDDGFWGTSKQQPKAAIRSTQIVSQVFAERYNQLLELLKSALPPNTTSYFQHNSMGTCDFYAFVAEHVLIVRSLDMGAYLNSRVHATHEMPTPKAFNFYKLKGFRTALNVRHPLGLVKSFAAKGLNHADNQLSDQARAPGSTVHDLATVARLGSPEWLARTARLLDKYYRPISERLESLTTVRFEYALQEPVGYVEDLAACLGLSLSKDSARSLSQIIGTAPLASNHFNSPAVDSWREHFTAADLDVVSATGLFSTFERFGYQPPATEDLKPLSDGRKKIAESLANGAAWHNATLDFRADFVGLMGSFSNDDLFEAFGKDRICTVRVGDFEIIGTDRDIIHEFSARLSARTLDVLDNSSKGSIVKRFF